MRVSTVAALRDEMADAYSRTAGEVASALDTDLRRGLSDAEAEAHRSEEVLRTGPSAAAMDAVDAIHDRLESPADRLLRIVSIRSNYVVLPVFALANAGVVISSSVIRGHGQLVLAVLAGLVVGKPLKIAVFTAPALAATLGAFVLLHAGSREPAQHALAVVPTSYTVVAQR